MDLRRLRYFVAVAEYGNISKAAERIFLTQPALSRQIKTLEEEVGHPLIERRAHSIELTPTGKALLDEARDLLRHADEALERVRSCARSVRLCIGYAPSLASGLLSHAVESFMQKHANVRVELRDLSSQEMLDQLQDGRIDIAITVNPERETRGLHWCPLAEIQWRLAVHHQHPLARRTKVSAAQIAEEPLQVYLLRDYPEYWALITAWMRKEGQTPAIGGEHDGIHSLLAAVDSGLGVAVVTTTAADFLPKKVRLKMLETTPKVLHIAAAYRTGREEEKHLAVFAEELRLAAQSSK